MYAPTQEKSHMRVACVRRDSASLATLLSISGECVHGEKAYNVNMRRMCESTCFPPMWPRYVDVLPLNNF